MIPLLQIEDTLLYKKTISYLDKQYAILINELKNHNSKKIASEIIASLKDDETEFFDRAANHVFMYYTELKDEIKANSNVQNFSQEVSRLLKGNNESLIKLLKDFGDKHEVIKKDNHTMEFIKDSITELTKKISHLSKRNSKCRKKSV